MFFMLSSALLNIWFAYRAFVFVLSSSIVDVHDFVKSFIPFLNLILADNLYKCVLPRLYIFDLFCTEKGTYAQKLKALNDIVHGEIEKNRHLT